MFSFSFLNKKETIQNRMENFTNKIGKNEVNN